MSGILQNTETSATPAAQVAAARKIYSELLATK
jgi:hypothetical protein